ncbi:type III toxin-antitoxin system ToxN/AbiQ family toxin [Lachnospiraceae bacterium 48-21]
MEEFKLYSVSDEYIEYLRKVFPNVYPRAHRNAGPSGGWTSSIKVYSNKETTRIHTRKYVGIVLCLGNYHYYIPMSSPKESDYQIAGEKKAIKKSIVPIIRIVVKNSKGQKELKGTLRISHMIPVPPSELQLYEIENEPDKTYKDLVQNEIIFIRKNQDKILSNAKLLYKQKQKMTYRQDM